MTFFPRREDS
jgi:acetoin utilization deacetylase AcuC-like enzyme